MKKGYRKLQGLGRMTGGRLTTCHNTLKPEGLERCTLHPERSQLPAEDRTWYSARRSFMSDAAIKTFHDKGKLKGCMTTKAALQRKVGGVGGTREEWTHPIDHEDKQISGQVTKGLGKNNKNTSITETHIFQNQLNINGGLNSSLRRHRLTRWLRNKIHHFYG